MTLFAIYERPSAAPAAIPEKFSWLAFLMPPVFALVHGLWLELIAYVVGVIALGFAILLGGAATFWLYVLFALWIGFAAPGLRRHALSHRGWSHRRDLVAAAPDLATLSWLESK